MTSMDRITKRERDLAKWIFVFKLLVVAVFVWLWLATLFAIMAQASEVCERVVTEPSGRAIQRAIHECRRVILKPKPYLISEPIVFDQGSTLLEGNNAQLIADNDELFVLHFASSMNVVRGPLTINGNDRSSLIGIAVQPLESEQAPPQQSYNTVRDVTIGNVSNAIRFKPAPGNDRKASNCEYNVFENVLVTGSGNAISFVNGDNAAGSCNDNVFTRVRVARDSGSGIRIDSGDRNTFTECTFEDLSGTAISVAYGGRKSGYNNSNRFVNIRFNGNVENIYNESPHSEFYGVEFDKAKTHWVRYPNVMGWGK